MFMEEINEKIVIRTRNTLDNLLHLPYFTFEETKAQKNEMSQSRI